MRLKGPAGRQVRRLGDRCYFKRIDVSSEYGKTGDATKEVQRDDRGIGRSTRRLKYDNVDNMKASCEMIGEDRH